MQFHRLINHVTRQILLCEIMLIEVQSWLKFRRGISQMISPWNARQTIKLCIGHIIGPFIVDIDQHFSIKHSPNNRIYWLFRPLSSPTMSGLRNYTFSVHKRLVDRHPYHEGRIYCPNSQEGNIRNFVSLTGSINIVNVTRVCNIIFGDYKFNNLFFPEFNQTYYYTL